MTNLELPPILFGTSGLGNLYVALSDTDKKDIVAECIRHSKKPVVFDSAGKYGAGLALESLGKCLRRLRVAPDEVLISNKLGWLRTELTTSEPTFEPGVWKELQYDARQKISYDGILECFEQGNMLLNGYQAQLVSVHDPDEYLAGAADQADKEQRYRDILGAYSALAELKESGKVKAVGIGSKDWRVIERISRDVQLDWVMIANSMTVHSHPRELVIFMKKLESSGVAIINSAVFNGGFLTGSDYYNYQAVDPENHAALYRWRTAFDQLCLAYQLRPAEVAAYFGLKAPGVKSIALNTTNPKRVADNIAMAAVKIPPEFWRVMRTQGLMDESYPYEYLNED
ncbi:aldo/keto reductase [Mucilaginibacter corticis]|uniref:Aldo/keto reductase n=1 Tax=Mucilaginibacter corticis TaxID=2597670 RepID=A0A556M9B8_9SPHI|nr:aldo/keto reductase [Mucilaginibacter corticis]TSJ36490.1 aldo/keto reductase [Mucilaginibacter corticis]